MSPRDGEMTKARAGRASESTPVADPSSRKEIWVRLLLYPTHTLPTAAAPVLVAVGLAAREGVLRWWPAALALFCSWLIHVAGVFADNHELLRRHGDVPEHPELLEALRKGTLSLSMLRAATLACLVLAALPGPYLAFRGGPLVIALGLLGTAASLSYAAGRARYARHGLADPIFFVMFGVVAWVWRWAERQVQRPQPTAAPKR